MEEEKKRGCEWKAAAGETRAEPDQDDLHTNLQKVADGWNNFLNGLSGRPDAKGDDAKNLLKGEGKLYECFSGIPGGKGKLDKLKAYHKAEVDGDTVRIEKEALTEDLANSFKTPLICLVSSPSSSFSLSRPRTFSVISCLLTLFSSKILAPEYRQYFKWSR